MARGRAKSTKRATQPTTQHATKRTPRTASNSAKRRKQTANEPASAVRGRPSDGVGRDPAAAAPAPARNVAPAPDPTPGAPVDGAGFPIVGIGASAGGLEALETFLHNVPADSGIAFVVVQHLDPAHRGILIELLQRETRMPVTQASEGTRVEPNHVYVIPPGQDLALMNGALHLIPQAYPRGLNLPIDFFFRSLAEDQQQRAIGVVLSGMGSDGTLGLRAIKEKAGAIFVQAISSAKFDGMPRSAIETGLADVVAPVSELPERIFAYCRHTPVVAKPEKLAEERTQSALSRVFVLLRSQTGNDFSQYKQSTILRRVDRRMGLHGIDSVSHYVRYLRENPAEIDLLFKELLIGVTSFFRDPAAWEHLENDVLPALLASFPAGGILRAWVPGCSTGEEAYSLAMVFKEAIARLHPANNITFQIFGTDLDREAIDRARRGVYPDNIAADVSPQRLRQFFIREESGYRISKDIREKVVFAQQNLVMDPPFTRLDFVSCRNLLIYLSAEVQKKLIPLFHYSLNNDGVLFLGSAETVGGFSNLFAPMDGKTRIYRRLDQAAPALPLELRSSAMAANMAGAGEAAGDELALPRPRNPNLQALADRAMVQRLAPVGVFCDDKGEILYVSGRAGKYLEPPVGKANLNLFAMAREGLRHELTRAFNVAVREQRLVDVRGVEVRTNGDTHVVDVSVQKLTEPKELRGSMLVLFGDVAGEAATPPPPPRRAGRTAPRIAALEAELLQAREEVQITREEMQTSQEELKSTNEELQSTNEELQSTNEELTTSKEEMQSLNEELQTVNHELQAKVDDLSRASNDMKNLLNSTDIATLFLDGDLNVRRFTTPTSKIIKLIAGDAGRPITDIASDLHYPGLADDAREVLRTLAFRERHVSTDDGRWFVVRIMPYRTQDNVIDGVVITFTDASAARALETALRDQASQLRQLAESLPNLVWGCRPDGVCDYLSRQWVEYTGVPEEEQIGWRWLEQVHSDDRERVRDAWRASVKSGAPFDTELRLRAAGGGYRWFKSRSVAIRDNKGHIAKWHGTLTDVDDLKQARDGAGDTVRRLAMVVDTMREGYVELDAGLAVRSFNQPAIRMLGHGPEDVRGKRLAELLPEIRGTAFERQIQHAARADAPTPFEAELPAANGRPAVRVRFHPHLPPESFALFLEPAGR